jgi:hypothetical protein
LALVHRIASQFEDIINLPNTPCTIETQVKTDYSARVKLPQLKIPEFHGDFTSWKTFKDSFMAMVHNMPMPDITKFHYLMGALKQDSINAIKEIPVTEANYQIAWKKLLDRYDNNRRIIEAHISKILSIKIMFKESAIELR